MKSIPGRTVFYLKTCSTNRKIMSALDLRGWALREIKSQPVTPAELDEMYRLTGSYEALFSKKSSQIRPLGINLKSLKEEDYKTLILQHYSFLKRPVFIAGDRIFAGNSKDTVQEITALFGHKPDSVA